MKKIKLAFMAAAALVGITSAFAFTTKQSGGWIKGSSGVEHHNKGTRPGEYTCNTANPVSCTYTDATLSQRFDTGTFILH